MSTAFYSSLLVLSENFEKGLLKDFRVNICALICDWKPTRKSRGSDHVSIFYLSDESNEGRERVELVLFSSSHSLLPQADWDVIGDIIILDTVKVQYCNLEDGGKKVQLFGKLNDRRFPNTSYSIVHAEAVISGNIEPHFKSKDQFLTEHQCQRVRQLSGYSQSIKSLKPSFLNLVPRGPGSRELTVPGGAVLNKVSDLVRYIASAPTCAVDIICKVLSLDKREKGLLVLHVWDGTSMEPVYSMYENDSPLVAGVWECSAMHPRNHALPLRSMPGVQGTTICTLRPGEMAACSPHLIPETGTAVPVVFPLWLLPETFPDVDVGLNSWVKFKKLVPLAVKGQVQLMYMPYSKTVLRSEAENGLEMGTRADDILCGRLSSGQFSASTSLDPSSCCSRVLVPESTEVVSIRHVLKCIHDGIPGIYRLNAQVLRFLPADAQHALMPLHELHLPAEEISQEAMACGHTFGLKILLSDATGELEAVLLGDEGENFFGELPPFDPSKDLQLCQKLQQLMDYLCGTPVCASSAPKKHLCWLDCCFKIGFLHPVNSQSYTWSMPSIRVVKTVGQWRAPKLT